MAYNILETLTYNTSCFPEYELWSTLTFDLKTLEPSKSSSRPAVIGWMAGLGDTSVPLLYAALSFYPWCPAPFLFSTVDTDAHFCLSWSTEAPRTRFPNHHSSSLEFELIGMSMPWFSLLPWRLENQSGAKASLCVSLWMCFGGFVSRRDYDQ